MSKIAVALLAFISGACMSWLLTGRVAVASTSTGSNNQKPQRSTITRSAFGNIPGGIVIEGAIPVFRALETTPIFTEVLVFNTKQSLDGFECHKCEFDNAELRYSGGAFNLEEVKFSGTTRVELSGAAANTVAFLKLLNGLSNGAATASPAPNKPIERKATTKKPTGVINFTPPFIGPKG